MTENNFELKIGMKNLVFDRPIKEVLEFENKFFIRFETIENLFKSQSTHKVNRNNNIQCFDERGNLIWEIEQAPKIDSFGGPYGTISIKNGKLISYHQMGCEFEIDTTNGKVKLIQNQRPW